MPTPPKVSVIMANYNGAAYLADAVQSVIAQTLTEWELIVVDDASTDESVELARRLAAGDQRIRVLVQEANAGPAAARNRALDAARGAWVAIVDSDDVVDRDRLERLLDLATAGGRQIVADNQLICSADLEPKSQYLSDSQAEKVAEVDLPAFLKCGTLYADVPDLGFLKPMISMAAIRQAGARYDEGLRVGEDYHFLLQLVAAGCKVCIDPQPRYRYRKHGQSISHRVSPANIEAMIGFHETFQRSASLDPATARILANRIRGLRAWLAYEQLVVALKRGNPLPALANALSRPSAWPLLTRPIRARLSRIGQGAASPS